MRPICLKGHERAITMIKYNRDGDLIFTSSKAQFPCVWYSDTGERLGTYRGHNGAVWTLDISMDSEFLLTGSADTNVKLWEVETGRELFNFRHKAPVRSVNFSYGHKMFLSVTDQVLGFSPSILLYTLSDDLRSQNEGFTREIPANNPSARVNMAVWGPLNETIISACEDASICVYDTETGKLIHNVKEHQKSVNKISFSQDGLQFITASSDHTAKLFDSRTFKCFKTYETDRPVNAAAISPLMDHVIVGGGQEADSVTTTHTRVGNFQTRFFHKIFEEELGTVKGHFGPIHTLAFHPDGKSFASGSEDGYVRIHHLDQSYFDNFSEDSSL